MQNKLFKRINKEVITLAYLNLKGEMAKRNISLEAIAQLLDIHRNSAANKVNGRTRFTVDEALLIRDTFFSDLSTDYLFQTEDD